MYELTCEHVEIFPLLFYSPEGGRKVVAWRCFTCDCQCEVFFMFRGLQ